MMESIKDSFGLYEIILKPQTGFEVARNPAYRLNGLTGRTVMVKLR